MSSFFRDPLIPEYKKHLGYLPCARPCLYHYHRRSPLPSSHGWRTWVPCSYLQSSMQSKWECVQIRCCHSLAIQVSSQAYDLISHDNYLISTGCNYLWSNVPFANTFDSTEASCLRKENIEKLFIFIFFLQN